MYFLHRDHRGLHRVHRDFINLKDFLGMYRRTIELRFYQNRIRFVCVFYTEMHRGFINLKDFLGICQRTIELHFYQNRIRFVCVFYTEITEVYTEII